MHYNQLALILLLPLATKCASEIPNVVLNNGVKIPIVGLGTYKSKPSKPNEAAQAVKDAIDAGYRHVDTALSYENEKEIGQAVAEKISEGVVKREDLFITSKLWNTFHNPDQVEASLKTSLDDLKVQYVDLYLMHWPIGFKKSNNGTVPTDDDYVDTWKAMENIYKKGLAKSIGVSNFNRKQIERILEHGTVVPVTNQIECHPYLNQKKLIEFARSKNITTTAYSPLGAPQKSIEKPNLPKILDNPTIKTIAGKYNKTTAQVLIRYQIQRNVIAIPKSTNKTRIIENFDVFDFELSNDDMNAINNLDANFRTEDNFKTHKYYPFNEEY